MKISKQTTLLLFTASLLFGFTTNILAADVIIENTTTGSSLVPTDSGFDIGQTFTATKTGVISSIAVVNDDDDIGDYTLKIYEGSGTEGTLLHTQTGSSMPDTYVDQNNYTFTTITIDAQVDIVSGNVYSFHFTPGSSIDLVYTDIQTFLGAATTPEGAAVISNDNGGVHTEYDMIFKVVQGDTPALGPTLTSATYNASTGVLVITGSDLTAGDGIDETKLTLTGEGGETYTLVEQGAITATNATTITINLDATNKAAVNIIFNKDGTASTSATTYNLAAASLWNTTSSDESAEPTQAITVSNVPAPSITSATYDYNSNTLTVTGSNFVSNSGATNDIDISKLTLTGENGDTYTITSASDVEITNGSTFSVTLSGADIVGVESLLNKDGTTADSGTTYNLAATAGFMVGDSTSAADTTGNGVIVSNYAVPTVTSATYDYSNGQLVVTGTNFVNLSGATNDIVASSFTLTGEGGGTYTLTDTANVEITSSTLATITLSATDKLTVNGLLNKDGTSSDDATTFNLAVADNWMAGSPASNNIADGTTPITVNNYIAPTITNASYDYNSNILTVTGTDFVSQIGALNDIDVSMLTITGEGGTTYTLISSTNVEITSSTSFSIALSGDDIFGVEALLNKNGTSSATSATTYNIAAADNWNIQAPLSIDISDTTNGITVSSFANPIITSTTYDWDTGTIVLFGTNFVSLAGTVNDITANSFTISGEGGVSYPLTDTANVEISSDTGAILTLSSTDRLAVNGLLNKDGTTSATAGTTFNLAAADNWMAGSPASNNIADATTGITVSNYATPSITSATYDYNSNILAVTGTNFVSKSGAINDIDISKLTLRGEGGATYTITSASDVEITSDTQFSITLSGLDVTNIESLLNKDGISSNSGTTYNLAVADNWLAQAPLGTDISDTTGNTITVSNYAAPTLTSATYDWNSGDVVLTGTNFVSNSGATNDIVANLFTFIGDGGTYTLTDSTNVEITSATSATITLSTTDKLNVHGLLNKNGTVSSGAITYNLALADDWMAGSPVAIDTADLTGNGITVSNVATPTITSFTYDSDTGVVQVTGTNFFKKIGANNDVDISKFTFTGEGGSYTLTSAIDVEISSSTSFSFTLTGSDKTNVDALFDQMGTSSSGGTTYNIAAADNWLAGADSATDISDATNAATVTINPKIISATYNSIMGVLVVSGTNIQANGGGGDIDASMFTFTGEGGVTYTLTDTANVERDSVSQFTLSLSATDRASINQILNKNGTSSTSGTTYNLAAADDWCTNVTAGDTSDTIGNALTASNVPTPTITSSTYNASTGTIVVTGTDFLKYSGALNDIDASKFTFTAEGGETYTLTDTADVEITSGTFFTLLVSVTDKASLNQIINKNGTSSTSGTTYNLAAAEDWNIGADAAANIVDATGNGVTVSNVATPTVTSATYDASSGVFVVTGTGFLKKTGATNDIDASMFVVTGEAGATYTLTDTEDVEISSGSLFTLAMSVTDKNGVNNLLNKNGTSSVDATTYNLAAAEDWAVGADAAVNVVDATGNGITVSNAPNLAPVITNFSGDTPAFTEGSASVLMDVGADLIISDYELDAFNSGNGDYNGSSFVILRNGGANSDDVFEFSDANALTLVGTNIQKAGATIATFLQTATPGELNVTMTNDNGQIPTTVDAQNILRQIKYKNTNFEPPANVQLDYTFYDGNAAGAQGSGGEKTSTGSVTVGITAIDNTPAAFTFTSLTNQSLSTVVTSETKVVTAIDNNIPISIVDGEYQKNEDGNWTSVSSTINNDDNVTVRLMTSGSYSTTRVATLTIGSSDITFSATTKAAPIVIPTPTPEPDSTQLLKSDADSIVTGVIANSGGAGTDSDPYEIIYDDESGTTTKVVINNISGKTITYIPSSEASEYTLDKAIASYNNNGTTEHSIAIQGYEPTVAISYIPKAQVQFTAEGGIQTSLSVTKDNVETDIRITATVDGVSNNSVTQNSIASMVESTIIGTKTTIQESGVVVIDTPQILSKLNNIITTQTSLDIDGNIAVSALKIKPDGTEELVILGTFTPGSEVKIQNIDGKVIVDTITDLNMQTFTIRGRKK